MRYFAEVGPGQKVLRVVVCDDHQWLVDNLGGEWVETHMDDDTEQYAGPGMFDGENVTPDRFVHEWRQPTHAENVYPKGTWLWHNGRCWRSLVDANVWEPGVAAWREYLVEWPEWIQPTGSSDAYQKGEKVSHAGGRYISLIDANVWSPTAYPTGWEYQV